MACQVGWLRGWGRMAGKVTAFLVWAALTLGVPSAAVMTQKNWAAHHPVIAVFATVAWVLASSAVAFMTKIFEKLMSIRADRAAVSIDGYVGRKLTRFEKRYMRHVRAKCILLEDNQSQQTVGFTFGLAEVYVDVSLAGRPSQRISGSPLAAVPMDITERASIWDYLPAQGQRNILALVGPPGCGKSTLLNYMGLELCGDIRWQRSDLKSHQIHKRRKRRLPVLLALRDHAQTILANSEITLEALVSKHLESTVVGSEPKGWIKEKLSHGRCIVMLDGLDEVARADDRSMVAKWIAQQAERYTDIDFVVTSRPGGYASSPIRGATVLQLRELTPDQIRLFVNDWYLALKKRRAAQAEWPSGKHRSSRTERRALEEAVRQQAMDGANDLLAKFEMRYELSELAVNPLLLTMAAGVHEYTNGLPGSRVELYESVCHALLFTRQVTKGIVDSLQADQKTMLVRRIAFEMMTANVSVFDRARMVEVIDKILPSVTDSLDSAQFLRLIVASGLLVEPEVGTYAFSHQTFQEYLASAYVREDSSEQLQRLIRNIGELWWRGSCSA
jgi:predicted NACHT family NTPase